MRLHEEHLVPGFRDVVAWGSETEIRQLVDQAVAGGSLVSMTVPRRHGQWWGVRLRMRHAPAGLRNGVAAGARPALPRPSKAGRWLRARPATVASVAAGGLVLCGLGWGLWQAVAQTANVVAGHGTQLGLVLLLAALVWVFWRLARADRARQGRAGAGGHHCPGCPHH